METIGRVAVASLAVLGLIDLAYSFWFFLTEQIREDLRKTRGER